MHELSLAQNVLELIEDEARSRGFHRVSKVTLEIGQLSAVDPNAMRFCFDAVMRGSIADGSVLEIVEEPGSGWCACCKSTIPMSDIVAACPYCGGYQLQVTGGKEMRLKTLEVG